MQKRRLLPIQTQGRNWCQSRMVLVIPESRRREGLGKSSDRSGHEVTRRVTRYAMRVLSRSVSRLEKISSRSPQRFADRIGLAATEPRRRLLDFGRTVAANQQRHRTDEWFRIDVLFFHRGICGLILTDPKLGEVTAGDVSQMHLYVNDARHRCDRFSACRPVAMPWGLCLSHSSRASLPSSVLTTIMCRSAT